MMTLSSTTAALDEELSEIREDAANWVVRLDEAGPEEYEALWAECEAWQAGDPQRRRVLAQMRQMWTAMRSVPERPGRRRRAGVVGIVLLMAAAICQLPWDAWTADHRTVAGEIRDVLLPDGSQVVLNSGTAIDVAYTERRRTIHLKDGELMAIVQKDPAGRPFRIEVRDGAATALGTRYSVRLRDGHSVVSVHESSVELTPRDTHGPPVTLAAGQSARLSASGVTDVRRADVRIPDWVDGHLVFNDVPLEEVVERLGHHRRGWLALSNEVSARNLRFTGALPAEDSDAALALLAATMSLEIHRVTPYVAWLDNHD